MHSRKTPTKSTSQVTPDTEVPPCQSLTLRLADGRVVQRERLFEFTPTQEGKLIKLVGLTRSDANVNRYVEALRIAVGRYQDLKKLNEYALDFARTRRASLRLSTAADTLIAQLARLRPQDLNCLNIAQQLLLRQAHDAAAELGAPTEHGGRDVSSPPFDRAVILSHWTEHPPPYPPWLQELIQNLQVLNSVAQQLGETDLPTPRGPKPNVQRLRLARQIAAVLNGILKRRPTTTRGGIFEETLRLCLQAVDKYVKDLHALVAKALAGMKFDPP